MKNTLLDLLAAAVITGCLLLLALSYFDILTK